MRTLSQHDIERMQRPDSELPLELRHEKIVNVRSTGSREYAAYQITFDQTWVPYDYTFVVSDPWRIQHARIEYHDTRGGFLGWLLPNSKCITITVTEDKEPFADTPWGR